MLKKTITYTDYDGEERTEVFWFNIYGVKSEDGKRFVKSPALTDEFIQSPAYDELFFELLNGGADAMAAFVNGVITIPEKERKKLLSAVKDANN